MINKEINKEINGDVSNQNSTTSSHYSFTSDSKIQQSYKHLSQRNAFKVDEDTQKIYGTKLITNFKHLGDVKYEKLSDIKQTLNYDPAHLEDYIFEQYKNTINNVPDSNLSKSIKPVLINVLEVFKSNPNIMNTLSYFFLNKNNIGFNFDGVPEYDFDAITLLKRDNTLSFDGIDTISKQVNVVRGKHQIIKNKEQCIDESHQSEINLLKQEIEKEEKIAIKFKRLVDGIDLTEQEKEFLPFFDKSKYDEQVQKITELKTQLQKYQSTATATSKWTLERFQENVKYNPNKLIIGENMDVLRNLVSIKSVGSSKKQDFSYDVIYIDPPYNTEATLSDGNRAADHQENVENNTFIYRDKFARNGWLSLMEDRLKLAKRLLNENGMIFVSIDDNEQAYLKVLMDQIFGENNFVENLVWINNFGGRSDKANFAKTHEYILVYAKNKNEININPIKVLENQNLWSYNEELQKYEKKLYDLQKGGGAETLNERPKLGYVVWWNEQTNHFIIQECNVEQTCKENNIKIQELTTKHDIYQFVKNSNYLKQNYVPILPKHKGNRYGRWRINKASLEELINDKKIKVHRSKNNYTIFEYAHNDVQPTIKMIKQKSIICNSNLWPIFNDNLTDFANLNNIETSSATIELRNILNNKVFDHPKPVDLIKHLINLHPNKNAKVLDFFAGSGTTGHAVLALNAQDNGKRTFTLVTNNENGIGEKITYERLFRINQGVGTQGESFPWIRKNQAFAQGLDVYWTLYYDSDILQLNRELNDESKNITLNDVVDTLEETYLNFGIEQKYELLDNIKKYDVNDLVGDTKDKILKLRHTVNPMELGQEVLLNDFYKFYLNQLKTLRPLKLENSKKSNKRIVAK